MCQEFNGHGHNLGEELGSGLYCLKGFTKIQAQTCENPKIKTFSKYFLIDFYHSDIVILQLKGSDVGIQHC